MPTLLTEQVLSKIIYFEGSDNFSLKESDVVITVDHNSPKMRSGAKEYFQNYFSCEILDVNNLKKKTPL